MLLVDKAAQVNSFEFRVLRGWHGVLLRVEGLAFKV